MCSPNVVLFSSWKPPVKVNSGPLDPAVAWQLWTFPPPTKTMRFTLFAAPDAPCSAFKRRMIRSDMLHPLPQVSCLYKEHNAISNPRPTQTLNKNNCFHHSEISLFYVYQINKLRTTKALYLKFQWKNVQIFHHISQSF